MKKLKPTTPQRRKKNVHPMVVGIGMSAGGLEAVTQLFSVLPDNTGLSFVLIQHLDPTHASTVSEILGRKTRMKVAQIVDRMPVRANQVYVIPPNSDVALKGQELRLQTRGTTPGPHMPIDFFFSSLAKDRKSASVGIILSGTGSDGTRGFQAIKAQGGFAIAQEPTSAKHDGMPRSAILAGVVDLILAPEKIALELAKFNRPGYVRKIESPGKKMPDKASFEFSAKDPFDKIIEFLRDTVRLDCSQYKTGTIGRRIKRRMNLHKIADLESYASFLQANPEETNSLAADLLIHVTEFFRDRDTFSSLKEVIFPKLIKNHSPGVPLRIWVPGCSTGEEVYSLAISLLEFMETTSAQIPFMIFGTDIADPAITIARRGIYPESISKNVSPRRLSKYFLPVEGGYQIGKSIRERCLFSHHDVTSDPPFAKMDLISCQNVLIYFAQDLQKKVIPIFHYALNPGGFLWLGRSEGLTAFPELFQQVSKKYKIYQRQGPAHRAALHFRPSSILPSGAISPSEQRPSVDHRIAVQREAERLALEEYAPPGVVVDEALEILQVRGNTAPFLSLEAGRPSLNLISMAGPELAAELRHAISQAKKTGSPAEHQGGKNNFKVTPIKMRAPSKEYYFSIVFENATGKSRRPQKKIPKKARPSEILSHEHQHLLSEYQSASEELVSANEELQSTNEELQSTNEELETAKEELQSGNEELTTVNEELQNRNAEILSLSNDLSNLLTSVEIPIVMVGQDKNIRRFTPNAARIFNLIPSDIGRPIGDIRPKIKNLELEELVAEVIESMSIKEIDTQDQAGIFYKLVVRPYRTAENKVDGAVIALIDINDLKHAALDLQKSRDDAQTIIESMPIPLLVIGQDLKVRLANRIFYQTFRVNQEETTGRFLFNLGEGQWNIPRLLRLIDATLTRNEMFKDFEVEHEFPQIGKRIILLNARPVQMVGSGLKIALLALEDITERVTAGKERIDLLAREKAAREEAETASKTKDIFFATLSHELRTPLTTILAWAQLIRTGKIAEDKRDHAVGLIEQSGKALARLIEDLMDVSRIHSGKLTLERQMIFPCKSVRETVEDLRPSAESKSIQIETQLTAANAPLYADPVRLKQIVANLLTNAIKFSPRGTKIEVQVDESKASFGKCYRIRVRDHGKGIAPRFLPHIFEHFSQEDSSSTRTHGGLGLGLAIVRGLVEMHGGIVQAESEGLGKGATFTVLLPLDTKEQQTVIGPSHKIDEASPQNPRPDLQDVRILVVDDEANAREVIQEALSTYGAEVHTASTVKEALVAIPAFKPQVLVSDIAMPEEDGYILIRKVRQLQSQTECNIPAVAITAYAGVEDRKRALEAGFDEYIPKPFDAAKVADLIAKLMNKVPGA